MDNIFKRFLLGEALDFSKPIIGLSPSKGDPNIHNVKGFISFDVTKSEVAINNAIQKIKDDLAKQDLVVSGVLRLNVYGGASNYLNGPMSADFKNTNADDPFKIEKAVSSDKELSGEVNKEKNVGYATNRANAVKDAVLAAFPSQGAVTNTYARIMDTGGVIDEKRDTNLYPIPGQQATFTMALNVKKKEKEIAPFNAAEVFKKTESNRTSTDSSYYGSENVKIGDKDVLMCKILSKNDTLGLKVDLPDIGLTKFQASITFDKNLNKYKIVNKNGLAFTKPQWVWIYWYLTNEQNANKNCKALDYIVLPTWLNSIDLNKVTFGAMDKEHEFVHNKAKHNLVKENKKMERIKLKKTEIERIIGESINELYKSTYNNAAAKAVSKGDENLAMDFLKHSNDMGIPDEAAAKKNYHDRGNRYMFFSNLQQMRRQCDLLLDLDPNMIEGILENGHDWAQDHIAEAKNNMDQVFDFLMNETKKSGMELSMNIDDKDMMSERWSEKYKRSIDCNNPKGFSQKAHYQGRKKR